MQGTLLRDTIHLVSARDYWPFALGTRQARREWWLRVSRHDVDAADLERAAARLRRLLADGPRPRAELQGELSRRRVAGRRQLARPRARAAVGHVGAATR